MAFDPWGSKRAGWYGILNSFESSGKAHLFAEGFRRQPAPRDMLRALWFETTDRDDKVRRALDLPKSGLPNPGWAKRVTNALWSGSFPSELGFEPGIEGMSFDGPSSWMVWVAAKFRARPRFSPECHPGAGVAVGGLLGVPLP